MLKEQQGRWFEIGEERPNGALPVTAGVGQDAKNVAVRENLSLITRLPSAARQV